VAEAQGGGGEKKSKGGKRGKEKEKAGNTRIKGDEKKSLEKLG